MQVKQAALLNCLLVVFISDLNWWESATIVISLKLGGSMMGTFQWVFMSPCSIWPFQIQIPEHTVSMLVQIIFWTRWNCWYHILKNGCDPIFTHFSNIWKDQIQIQHLMLNLPTRTWSILFLHFTKSSSTEIHYQPTKKQNFFEMTSKCCHLVLAPRLREKIAFSFCFVKIDWHFPFFSTLIVTFRSKGCIISGNIGFRYHGRGPGLKMITGN